MYSLYYLYSVIFMFFCFVRFKSLINRVSASRYLVK
jgi:hypothetical protein